MIEYWHHGETEYLTEDEAVERISYEFPICEDGEDLWTISNTNDRDAIWRQKTGGPYTNRILYTYQFDDPKVFKRVLDKAEKLYKQRSAKSA